MKEKLIVWKYFQGTKKIYTESKETMKKLIRTKSNILSSTYFTAKTYKAFAWDIIVPITFLSTLRKAYTIKNI